MKKFQSSKLCVFLNIDHKLDFSYSFGEGTGSSAELSYVVDVEEESGDYCSWFVRFHGP